ncbi:MAG: hypothetical protein LBL72_06435 [Candidatus Accumulibacter sp.]|jgi:hypothetical protein|nr:hypothetical protein [Accumulibacter sp.]
MNEKKPDLVSVPKPEEKKEYLPGVADWCRYFLPFPEDVSREDRLYMLTESMQVHVEEIAKWWHSICGDATRTLLVYAALNVFSTRPKVWEVLVRRGFTEIGKSDVLDALHAVNENFTRKTFSGPISLVKQSLRYMFSDFFKQVAKTPNGRDDADLVAEAFCNFIEKRFPKKVLEHKAPSNVFTLRPKA